MFQHFEAPLERVSQDPASSPGVMNRSRSWDFHCASPKMESNRAQNGHIGDVDGTIGLAGVLDFLWNDCKTAIMITLLQNADTSPCL